MAMSNKIVESVVKSDQTVSYQLLEVSNGHKLKFSVLSTNNDSYCWAHVFVWHDETKNWNNIYSIDPQDMKTRKNLHYGSEPGNAEDFQQDITELRRIALAVLS